jgi:hypothetical protein
MKPIEFITDVGQYNASVGIEMEARVNKELIITDGVFHYEILSYYWTPKGMCLDIQKKEDNAY